MRRLSTLLSALLLVAACSTPQVLPVGISDPPGSAVDARLEGTWVRVEAAPEQPGPAQTGWAAILQILPSPDGSFDATVSAMAARTPAGGAATGEDSGGPESEPAAIWYWAALAGYGSDLDGRTYYNLRVVEAWSVEKPAGKPGKGQVPQEIPKPGAGFLIARTRFSASGLLRVDLISDGYFEKSGIDPGTITRAGLTDLLHTANPDALFGFSLGVFRRVDGNDPAQPDD